MTTSSRQHDLEKGAAAEDKAGVYEYMYYSEDHIDDPQMDPYREGTMKQILRDKPIGSWPKLIAGCVLFVTYIGLLIGGAVDPAYDCWEILDEVAGSPTEGEMIDYCGYVVVGGKDSESDDDEINIGLIWGILLMIYLFANSGHWFTTLFFKFVPTITLMYFLPGLLGSCRVTDPTNSNLYSVASHYGLPAILFLLCLGADINKLVKLGWRALLCFFMGTIGVMFGGPLAVALMGLMSPETVCGDRTWRALSYLAGSWIGGGANATAMIMIFEADPRDLPLVIAIDTIAAMIMMMSIFTLIEHAPAIDRKTKANSQPIKVLINDIQEWELEHSRNPTASDMLMMAGSAMLCCGLSNGLARVVGDGFDQLPGQAGEICAMMALNTSSFWRVMLATIFGLVGSFTSLKRMENTGASKLATVMLYFLILTLGMQMDIRLIGENPALFAVGVMWLLVHVICIAVVGVAIKAPLFYMCIGSQANIGAAASAPVVAAAFHPSLAPVGVIFGIFGYVIGTWCAWACSMMMQLAAPECPV